MMSFRKSAALSISLFITLTSLMAQSRVCLPDYRYGPQTYSFLRPTLVNPTIASAPFLLPFQEIYAAYGRQDRLQVRTNLQEWHERFCEVPDINDMGRLIYQASIRDLQALESAVLNARLPVPISLQSNSFASYIKRHECKETVEYLIYAKRCEPYAVLDDPWADRQKYVPDMRDLIDQGLRQFRRTESHYYRLRYAYQIIRLAHYAREYQRVLDLHEYLMPKTDNDPSIIEYWIMGHRAGALRALGQEVEAAYLFSRVFEECAGKRESAFQSFQVRNDAQWEELLERCASPEEQATLYALQARGDNARIIDEMEAIYALDPDNHHLEVLLVKAMALMEEEFLGTSFNRFRRENKRYHDVPDRRAGQELIRLQTFVRLVVRNQEPANPMLWEIAQGYLAVLAGDFYAATEHFEGLEARTRDPKLKSQLKAMKLVLEIVRMDELNDRIENRLAEIQFDNATYRSHPDFPDLVYDKLVSLYANNNQAGKLYLLRYSFDDLWVNPDIPIIDSLLILSGQTNLNRMERSLLRQEANLNLRNDLYNLKGMLHLARGNQIPAIEALKQIDNVAKNDYARINPFEERLIDCINCARQDSFRRYNREQLINRFQELEYEALADQSVGARNFYLIGLALYNMTYFGYAWEGMDNFRSGISLKVRPTGSDANVRPHPKYPDGNREAFDCQPALKYFETALGLAKNPELAARAAFMAAKCEQNQYFAYGGERTYQYFTLLREQYSGTNFYQEAIEECAYLEYFVNR
jgi:hypothetical protein